jgi:hypothetical protein
MTQEDFLQIESSQRQHHEEMRHYQDMINLTQVAEYNLFSLLKPSVSIDGNQYCVLLGKDLHDGIAGFGNTIHDAILDFNNQFYLNAPKLKSVR